MTQQRAGLVTPVILAGGRGLRLWPLSRARIPKQLAPIEGIDKPSLLARTLRRCQPSALFTDSVIVTTDMLIDPVCDALQSVADPRGATILAEPEGRNTAIAVLVAAFWAMREDPSRVLAALPADHAISRPRRFHSAIRQASHSARLGRITLVGEAARHGEPDYGYIEPGEMLSSNCYQIRSFREKPSAEEAAEMVASGCYLWNSGMFVFRASDLIQEADRYAPEISAAAKQAVARARKQGTAIWRLARLPYRRAPALPLDRAIMEHTRLGAVVKADMGWRDLGGWQGLWENSTKDVHQNATSGPVLPVDTQQSYLRSDGPLLVTAGIQGLAVVATRDAVLVTDRKRQPDAGQLAAKLAKLPHVFSRTANDPTRETRPWGAFETILHGSGFAIKRLTIQPGKRLSMQRHGKRSEHWVVVQGSAEIVVGTEHIRVEKNQSAFIPQGVVHRLANPGLEILEVIEVQVGDYLGEDDIERLADDYGREPGAMTGRGE